MWTNGIIGMMSLSTNLLWLLVRLFWLRGLLGLASDSRCTQGLLLLLRLNLLIVLGLQLLLLLIILNVYHISTSLLAWIIGNRGKVVYREGWTWAWAVTPSDKPTVLCPVQVIIAFKWIILLHSDKCSRVKHLLDRVELFRWHTLLLYLLNLDRLVRRLNLLGRSYFCRSCHLFIN